MLNKLIKWFDKVGVIKRANDSKWGAPYFVHPKRNCTVRFLYNFNILNKQIKCKPNPMPKFQ